MDLTSLIYRSTAARSPLPAQLMYLLERAQARNAEYAVTGVLLYSDDTFFQCIEGPPDSISHIFGIIQSDLMHRDVIVISRAFAKSRDFPEWSMALQTTAGSHMSWGGPVLSQRLVHPPAGVSVGRSLLAAFWEQAVSRQRRDLAAG